MPRGHLLIGGAAVALAALLVLLCIIIPQGIAYKGHLLHPIPPRV
jgi:hypothetical protein